MVTGATKVLKKAEVLKADFVYLAAADVDSDASSQISISFPGLKTVVWAHADIQGGYRAVFRSAALNVVTFDVYWVGPAVSGVFALVTASTANLGNTNAVAFGY